MTIQNQYLALNYIAYIFIVILINTTNLLATSFYVDTEKMLRTHKSQILLTKPINTNTKDPLQRQHANSVFDVQKANWEFLIKAIDETKKLIHDTGEKRTLISEKIKEAGCSHHQDMLQADREILTEITTYIKFFDKKEHLLLGQATKVNASTEILNWMKEAFKGMRGYLDLDKKTVEDLIASSSQISESNTNNENVHGFTFFQFHVD